MSNIINFKNVIRRRINNKGDYEWLSMRVYKHPVFSSGNKYILDWINLLEGIATEQLMKNSYFCISFLLFS